MADDKIKDPFSDQDTEQIGRRQHKRHTIPGSLKIPCRIDQEDQQQIEVLNVSEGGIAFRVPYSAANAEIAGAPELDLELHYKPNSVLPARFENRYAKMKIESGHRYLVVGGRLHVDESHRATHSDFLQFIHNLVNRADRNSA